jgi:hypothetical protein
VTLKAAFNADEWNLLRALPPLVSAGVAAADPSGLIGSFQEAAGGMKGMAESLQKAGGLELAKELLADKSLPSMPDARSMMGEGAREQQLGNFRAAVLAKVREGLDLLKRKGTPEEVAAYREMLLAAADRAANAAKEGGFLGFGGERVSAAEKSFLVELKGAVDAAA